MMAFLLVGTFCFVTAEDVESEVVVPEARKIGFFGNAFDRIDFALTFNKEKKIEKVLEMAEKRLAEAEASGDTEEIAIAQERYDELVARAEEILADIESRAEDRNGSINEMEQIARIQNRFERHREHAGEIYARALERFEANNASDEKIERFEMFYERALNRSDRLEAKILEKRENSIKKQKVLSEMSDEELENLLAEIEEREGLKENREKRIERAEVRIEKLERVKEKNIERIKERLNSSDLTDEEKLRIENRMIEAEKRFEEHRGRFEEKNKFNDSRFPIIKSSDSGRLKDAIKNELANR
jgi:hypothetical protein